MIYKFKLTIYSCYNMSSRLEAIINDYETTLIHSSVNRIIKIFAIPYIPQQYQQYHTVS